jgi:hypothetical protein
MGTMTAQFLIGHSHMYEGGIIPSHQLFLSENGRPAWILRPIEQSVSGGGIKEKPVVWIATLENMLEDALLLIGLHVLQDKETRQMAKDLIGWNNEEYLELYSFAEEDRADLYSFVEKRLRNLNTSLKLTLNIFNGSSMLSRWKALQSYPFEVEVTLPRFERHWNPFSQQMVTHEGSEV